MGNLKAILLHTDNEDYKYCVQIYNTMDNGRNYLLMACRYFETELEAKEFLGDLNFEVTEMEDE